MAAWAVGTKRASEETTSLRSKNLVIRDARSAATNRADSTAGWSASLVASQPGMGILPERNLRRRSSRHCGLASNGAAVKPNQLSARWGRRS